MSDVINQNPKKNKTPRDHKIVDSLPITDLKTANRERERAYLEKNIGNELAMKCWNCDATLIIFQDWRIVQCTQCHKLNRIAGSGSFDHKEEGYIDGKLSYKDKPKEIEFDIMFPVTHSIVNCPFCKNDNKISRKAKAVLCYACKNNFSVNQFPFNKFELSNSYNPNPPKNIRKHDPLYTDKVNDMHNSYNERHFSPNTNYDMNDYLKRHYDNTVNTSGGYDYHVQGKNNQKLKSTSNNDYYLTSTGDGTYQYVPRHQTRWTADYQSLVNSPPEEAPRVSDVLPDVIHYPGVYPVFNPYSFYPWFAHYWDLYEKEFEDLVERREKYELFKDLLRQEEHEYLHINRPKEKYRAINHLMGAHQSNVKRIDDYTYNRKSDYNPIIKKGDKDKDTSVMYDNNMKYVSNIGGQTSIDNVFVYGADKGQRNLYKFKDNDFKYNNSSTYEQALSFGKNSNAIIGAKNISKFLTPTLDNHMTYDKYKFDNGFKRDPPYYSNNIRENGSSFNKNENNRYN